MSAPRQRGRCRICRALVKSEFLTDDKLCDSCSATSPLFEMADSAVRPSVLPYNPKHWDNTIGDFRDGR